ncbi:hypothetical protein M8H41_10910 [Desulfosporosinus nitroreducens]|uniref:Uncharacterized protein n=1 Tax=Desulfosporosinus nitroreducens TaxID=2018668 RepID=A0ABT8QPS6_9FIRM|nr:hypothetical protein [Desulfosporosinus nitroreducens]MDO0823362.1 hypothetical protein [Desulfosporosinus nitroreducens]
MTTKAVMYSVIGMPLDTDCQRMQSGSMPAKRDQPDIDMEELGILPSTVRIRKAGFMR